jgi:hypothetical protein
MAACSVGQVVHTKGKVSDFVNTDEPVPVLGTFNQLVFDEAAAEFEKHEATTEEIKVRRRAPQRPSSLTLRTCLRAQLLFQDLKTLGKSDLKQLLKWRLKMRTVGALLAGRLIYRMAGCPCSGFLAEPLTRALGCGRCRQGFA